MLSRSYLGIASAAAYCTRVLMRATCNVGFILSAEKDVGRSASDEPGEVGGARMEEGVAISTVRNKLPNANMRWPSACKLEVLLRLVLLIA